MAEESEEARMVARCAAVVSRAAAGQIDDESLAPTVADLGRLPEDLPARGPLAGNLMMAMVRTDLSQYPHRWPLVTELLALADRNPPLVPDWHLGRAGARALALLAASLNQDLPDVDAALREVDELELIAGGAAELSKVFALVRMGLTQLRGLRVGDDSTLRILPEELARIDGLIADRPDLAPLKDTLAEAANLLTAFRREDHEGTWTAVRRVQESAERLPSGNAVRDAVAEMATMLEPLRPILSGSAGPEPDAAALSALAELVAQPDASAAVRAFRHAAAGGASFRLGEETDLGRIEEGIELLRQALALSGPHDDHRAFYLSSLALGLLRRSEVTGTVDGLDEAVALLEAARTLLGGPHHQHWTMVNELLSAVRRRRGESVASRQAGLDGLRSYAWRALVRDDLADARAAVRDAAREAVDVARQCLIDGDPGDALRALDAGRGLLLFGAAERRDLAGRLAEAQQDGSLAALLDPPSLSEIRDALRTLDADALVYLVPADPPLPGWAVIAPADEDEPPGYVALPNLAIEGDVDVERYLSVLAGRSAGTTRDMQAHGADTRLFSSLDALCDWAWRAAIGPLVETYLEPRPAAPSGRPPRVILIPVGDLARIPWQAARRADGLYAIQVAAFSQTASARMLCDTAARAPVPVSPVGLVVGDPQTRDTVADLPDARLEARAIRRAFYPGARYLGRRPDGLASASGSGSADQVRAWLRSTSPAAGSMLHLACHGVADTTSDPPRSFLLLAGGDELDAAELLAVMTGAPGRSVGLVVLAACHTGTSVYGFDEAYSLGTAFLAGGARTVLSTQWSIPDQATSSLMFMFHHFLRVERMPAWQALREAQLRMLDRQLDPPASLPDDRRPARNASFGRVAAWAGFVHFGQ